jgi:hypothetical protein
MSLLHQKKSTNSLSYLGSKLAPICTVLAGSSISICTTLVSSAALKMPDVEGMAGLSDAVGTRRLISRNLATATAVDASLMMSYSQSSACCILASSVITPTRLGILSLR